MILNLGEIHTCSGVLIAGRTSPQVRVSASLAVVVLHMALDIICCP